MLVPSHNPVEERGTVEAPINLDTRQSLDELKNKVAAEQEGKGASASITEHPYPVGSGASSSNASETTTTATASEDDAWKDKWSKRPSTAVKGGPGGWQWCLPYGPGGGDRSPIPPNIAAYAGRYQGGGTRDQIYGSRTYGSGNPDDTDFNQRGVHNSSFPFYFWPVVWSGIARDNGSSYLYEEEFGAATNVDRPGGPLMYISYITNDPSKEGTIHIVSDNSTILSLIIDIEAKCASHFDERISTFSKSTDRRPVAVVNSTCEDPASEEWVDQPRVETTAQYYRASSIALTLDGYNNTANFNATLKNNGTFDVLPGDYDGELMKCLNATIGQSSLLVDPGAHVEDGWEESTRTAADGALLLLSSWWVVASGGVVLGALMNV